MLRLAISTLAVLAITSASSIPAGMSYGVPDFNELMRLQQFYSQFENEDPYGLDLSLLDDGIDGRSDETISDVGDDTQSLWADMDPEDAMEMYKMPFAGQQARDEEHLENSALQGLHQVAGGTLEGGPESKQVKTDKPLPAYCNPPNPCPVGKTEADNCVENFENSMENNKDLLSKQDCPCDTEHMWSCPAGQQTVTSKGAGGQAALSKVMSELAQLHNDEGLDMDNNPYLTAGKREKLVAKKSPGMYRNKRAVETPDAWSNPSFEGEKLDSVMKKAGPAFRINRPQM